MIRAVLFLAALLMLAGPVAAETEALVDSVIRGWGVEDGLPQSTVNDLLQDEDGFIWIATFGGLSRFDGDQFVNYTVAQHPGLPSDRLTSLVKTADGALWIGSERSGAGLVHHGRFAQMEPEHPLADTEVLDAANGPNGDLWFAIGRGLVRISSAGVETIDSSDGLPGVSVLRVAVDEDGTVWAGTRQGLWRVRDGVVSQEGTAGMAEQWIRAILRSRDGTLWVGGGHGLVRLVDGQWMPPPEGLVEPGEDVSALMQSRDGALWVGGDYSTLRRWDGTSVESFSQTDGLPKGAISVLFEDRESNVWFGTVGNGIHRLRPAVAAVMARDSDLAEEPFLPVVADGEGGVWAGLSCGGIVHLDRAGRVVGQNLDLSPSTCVWSLHLDRNNSLWVGSFGGSLARVRDGETRVVKLGDTIRCIIDGGGGFLLVGSGTGLWRVDSETMEAELVEETRDLHVYDVEPSPDGSIWLATGSGLHRFDADGDKNWSVVEGFGPNVLRELFLDHDGVLWIGSYGGGLYRLENGSLTHIGSGDGLFEDVVSFIAEDASGYLWMTGNRGVTRVRKDRLEALMKEGQGSLFAELFGVADGMPVNETNGGGQPAGLLDEHGRLWVPTVAGLARFNTSGTSVATPPPILIDRVTVGGDVVDGGDGLFLGGGTRNLEVHYSAPYFSAPERVRFFYRMVGLDPSWVDAGSRRVAFFPYLPPGHHRFEVTASVGGGLRSNRVATIDIYLEPTFTQTWWFTALLVLASVALVAGFGLLRHRMQVARRRELEIMVRARTAEIDLTAALAEKISTALHVEEVLEHVYESMDSIIPYDRIGYAEVDPESNVARAVWARSKVGEIRLETLYEAAVAETSLGEVLESGKPRVLNDLQDYLREHPNSESTQLIVEEGMLSSLTCPLHALGQPVGLLFFSSTQANAYNEEHARWFQRIAVQLSHMIGKSKMYESLLSTSNQLAGANVELERLATHDELTGLPNRRAFEDRLLAEWHRAARNDMPVSVLMIDIDAFKAFNDSVGHAGGDACLQRIADTLDLHVRRAEEAVFRYGGEEFVVVIGGGGLNVACRRAEALRAAVEALQEPHPNSPIGPCVTISVGAAAEYAAVDGDPQELVNQADQAMYAAKHAGRNRCHVAGAADCREAEADF